MLGWKPRFGPLPEHFCMITQLSKRASAVLTVRKSVWFREGNQPSIVTAAAGMLGWLLATSLCRGKLEKVQADRVAMALPPMLQSLSALAQQHSCAAALWSCLCS